MDFQGNVHAHLQNVKRRLQRQWNEDFVNAAVTEYAKFLHLHKTYPDTTLVPGKMVDIVWHEHILHTQNYTDFCQEVFGSYLHHEPKDLSAKEAYSSDATHELYEKTFGYSPPKAYWSDSVPSAPPAKPTSVPSTVKTTSSGFDCRCGCR